MASTSGGGHIGTEKNIWWQVMGSCWRIFEGYLKWAWSAHANSWQCLFNQISFTAHFLLPRSQDLYVVSPTGLRAFSELYSSLLRVKEDLVPRASRRSLPADMPTRLPHYPATPLYNYRYSIPARTLICQQIQKVELSVIVSYLHFKTLA